MTLNLRGKQIGRLTVLSPTTERQGKSIIWRCKCLCGNANATVSARDLVSTPRKGCGACGDASHPLYGIYRGMLTRCEDENSTSYKHYGGRGIIVCARWKAEFLHFVVDVGVRPSIFMSIDRIDVNGNYEPNNVRWADDITQANNRRPVEYGLGKEEIIEIYRSKEEIKFLENKFKVAEKTIRNIKARSYSPYATDVIVNHIIETAKKKYSGNIC